MRRVLALLIASLLLASCSDDAEAPDEPDEPDVEDATGWTVLQYQIADTDLEPFLMEDVDEMGIVGSTEHLTIRALVDRASDHGDADVLDLGSWVGGKVVDIGAGAGEVVEELGDVNTGDPAVLADFIADGIAAHPAEHYALVLSDHGASWPGIGGDEGSGHDTLVLAELQSAIRDGLDEAGVDKLDILGFDACLMATYEVASAMAPVADRLIASSELEPGHGWDYQALAGAAADPGVTPDELGTAIVDRYYEHAQAFGTEASVTLALLDLTRMDDVGEAMADFTAAVAERGGSVAPQIGRARPDVLGYGRSPDPTQDSFMTDLGDLAARIGVEALDVADQADALVRSINDAVVHKVQGPAAEAFSGLSVYFPDAPYFAPEYEQVVEELDLAGGWMDFLTSFYTAGDALAEEEQAELIEPEDGANVTIDDEGLTITGSFDPAIYENLADAYISYGFIGTDGSITYFGDESATFLEDGSAEGFFDLTQLILTDGIDEATAYVSLTSVEDVDGFTIDIPMTYYPVEEGAEPLDVLLEVVVDGEGTVTQETYYVFDEEIGTYGELTADPEALIVPDVLVVDADGNVTWEPTSDVGLFADLPEILYDFQRLPSGTELYVELVVEDFAGNTDSVSSVVTLP